MNGWSDQTLPFQRITAPDVATAVQAFVALQDMSHRKLPSLGCGVGSIVQAVPFHRSANADEPEAPTAMQMFVAVHDTAFSWPPPLGFGVGWICHAVPFQRSASVEAPEYPTAVHAFVAVHDTAFNTPPPLGVGVGWIDHPEARADRATAPPTAIVNSSAVSALMVRSASKR